MQVIVLGNHYIETLVRQLFCLCVGGCKLATDTAEVPAADFANVVRGETLEQLQVATRSCCVVGSDGTLLDDCVTCVA
jgi:hypothetical protein